MTPSLNNWGFAIAEVTDTGLIILDTGVLQNKPSKDKIKQNVKDFNRCKELYEQLLPLVKDIDTIYVELPTGSQSSRAMVSYAICVAITACLSHTKPNTVITTPKATKTLVGASDGSKDVVINWVKDKYPYLDLSIKSKAEHIADAICAIHVGMNL